MEIQIPAGVKGREELVVAFEDTAAKYGSGLVEVYATPAMVALMEKTCLNSVLPYLPEGHGTVGVKVDIVHSKATPVGMKVTCESTLLEVDRRRLVFELLAKNSWRSYRLDCTRCRWRAACAVGLGAIAPRRSTVPLSLQLLFRGFRRGVVAAQHPVEHVGQVVFLSGTALDLLEAFVKGERLAKEDVTKDQRDQAGYGG